MGEVIRYDFRGDKGITDRSFAWPEIPREDDLIAQAKSIYASLLVAQKAAMPEIVDKLTANLEKCMNALGAVTDKTLDEIHSDGVKQAEELRKEII